MQKNKVTKAFFGLTSEAAPLLKVIVPALLILLLFASQITPLYAQLNSARNLSGTWQSSSPGMYYEMDPAGTGIRETDVTATFEMDITQEGNQISITLDLNPSSWVTDPAYTQEYGIPAAPEIAGSIDFSGTVSSSSFTATEQGALTQEQLTGSFTSDIITATLTGNGQETNPNGIVVTLTSSSTPTTTSAPTSTPASTQPTFNRFLGAVSLFKGLAWFTNSGMNVPLSSGQMGSGNTVLTGNNSIVGFTYPMEDGTVYLDGNTAAGWVALTSEPGPENQVIYTVYPSNTALPNSWGTEGWETVGSMALEAAIGAAVFGEAVGTAAAVSIIVEGGVFLIHSGTAYINEHSPHLIQVPQGIVAGENTQYVVNVNAGVTTVQVIDGPVYFIDPSTNNTITVETNQMLTLPAAGQSGFSEQELQSDVSSFSSASINQWWTQTTPNGLNGFSNFLSSDIIIIAVVIAAIIIAVAAVGAAKRKGNQRQQPSSPQQKI